MKLFKASELFDGNELKKNAAMITDGASIAWVGGAQDAALTGLPIDETQQCAFIMPGLIDCHVHLASLESAPQTPMDYAEATAAAVQNLRGLMHAGVVACRDLGSTGGLPIGLTRAQQSGKLNGLPLLVSAGRALTATGGHGCGIGLECDGGDGFIRGCRQVIKEGAQVVKVMMSGGVNSPGEEPGPPEVSQEEIDLAVLEAHARGRKVAVHAHGNTAIRRSVLAHVDSVEHGVFNSEDIMEMMAMQGTFLVPTLSAPYYAVSEGLRLDPNNPDHKRSKEVVARHNQATLRAFKTGVKLAMGTDAGCPFNPFNRAYFELILLVRAGFSPLNALRIGTRNGAQLMGLERLGTLEKGREASFLCLEKSPAEDIEALECDKQVWIQGQRRA